MIRPALLLSALALTLTVAGAPPTRAQVAAASEPRRIAVLVGNNVGSGVRPPLRYAEDDAVKLAAVLVELGGFRAEDVRVLRGGTLATVHQSLGQVRDRVENARRAGQRVMVLFFFSGHSDGQVLELGTEGWAFSDLRRRLAELGADVRLAVIDSCRSGALLARKGGTPGPSFDIRMTDELATSGEAVLTSSAADEMALESREIRGSFFSHHLVSGLRGAADSSGDGRVTLNEAYRYAFVNTLLATSGTLSGPQHPAYDYSITGRGELVLTETADRGARLTLPEGFERILVADGGRRALVAELTTRSAHRIALPPGAYFVQARRDGRSYQAHLRLALGEDRTLTAGDLTDGGPRSAGALKGGDLTVQDQPVLAPENTLAFFAGAGAMRAAADVRTFLPGLRLGLRHEQAWGLRSARGMTVDLEVGSARGDGYRESTVRAAAGLFVATARGPLRGRVGLRLSAGPSWQRPDEGSDHVGAAVGLGPTLSLGLALGPSVGLFAQAGLDGVLLRRDARLGTALWPAAFLGLELGGL